MSERPARRVLRGVAAVLAVAASVLVVIVAGVVMLIVNSVGAPQPDGDATRYPVSDGHVRLLPGPYELGVEPDTAHPGYRGGTPLANPGCEVFDPAGAPVRLLDPVREPPLNPFTVYGRFEAPAEGRYRLTCADVAPVPADLVVRTDVWGSERERASQRRTTSYIVLGVAGLVFVGLNVLAIRIIPRNRPGASHP